MIFWVAAGLLTLGASLAVLLPLTAPARRDDERARDLAVYRDQLDEVERDRARGLIAADAAEEARAEIGRRILRLDPGAGGVRPAGASPLYRYAVAAAVLFVPLASWGLYAALGSPDLPAQPLSARLDKAPGDSTVEELLARAEAYLREKPEDARGWSTVAPIYLRLGRYAEAAAAYANASRTGGATADREAGLGEALAGVAGGAITADARAAFERALKLEPKHALARFQLAAASAQEGRNEDAVAAWNAMLAALPADSPWRGIIAQAVASIPAGGPATGSAGKQVADAGAGREADQSAMIENMVAGLDRKLRSNPRDPDGWMRLVRSYVVLERPDAARDALARGRMALGAESAEGRKLVAFAQSLGLEEAQP